MRVRFIEFEFSPYDDPNAVLSVLSVLRDGDVAPLAPMVPERPVKTMIELPPPAILVAPPQLVSWQPDTLATLPWPVSLMLLSSFIYPLWLTVAGCLKVLL
ncbi:hypothetical protein IV102_05545 [bacterium]|nr:hypothetical protein [bacterium]